jgi:hypothetical protein
VSSATARRGRLLFGILLSLVVGWALLLRLRLPAAPFADHDFAGYLFPAVRLFTEGKFVHFHSREFPYPLFVHGVTRVFGGLTDIALAQHLIGVASGLLLLWAWQRIPLPTAAAPWLVRVRAALGVALAASYLLLTRSILYEHLVRPEALSQAVQCVLLFAAMSVLRLEPGSPDLRRRFCLHGGGAFVSASLLGLLRPQITAILPVWILWMLWSAWRLRIGMKVGAIALLAPALLSLVALWIPERRLAADDPVSGRFLPGTLLAYHFDLVEKQLAEDLAATTSPRDERFLRELLAAFETERARHARELDVALWYGDWDFTPGRLLYGRANKLVVAHFGDDRSAYREFGVDHFVRAVSARPLDYSKKVLHELGRYYGFGSPTIYEPDPSIDLRQQTQASRRQVRHAERDVPHPRVDEWVFALEAEAAAIRAGSPGVVYATGPGAAFHRGWFQLLNGAFMPTLLVALPLALLSLRRRTEVDLVVAFLLPASCAFAANLTSAASASLVPLRYAYAITPLSFFTQFAMLLYLAARIVRWRASSAGFSTDE